jgi:uncharacterized coiled-coil protein SlyX
VTNGRVARLHRMMTERVSVQDETIVELRRALAETINDVDRLRGDLASVFERFERIEDQQQPRGYRGRRLA